MIEIRINIGAVYAEFWKEEKVAVINLPGAYLSLDLMTGSLSLPREFREMIEKKLMCLEVE
jgi:hypothetical protein